MVAVLISLSSSLVLAKDDSVNKADFISTEKIKTMSAKDLESLRDQLVTAISDLKAITKRPANSDAPLEKISAVARVQTQESMEALIMVSKRELNRIQEPGLKLNPEVLEAALKGIESIGTALPHRNVEDILTLSRDFEYLSEDMKANPAILEINKRFLSTINTLNSRQEVLINLNDLLFAATEEKRDPVRDLETVEQILKEGIQGQDEVIEALMALEWRNTLYGKSRIVPDAIYLMGLPGAGRDTAAETLTDALHRKKGAYKNHMFRLPVMKNDSDLWRVFGSATGFVGSSNLPPFLEFLVLHSGGKYKIEMVKVEGGREAPRIVLNPNYKGDTLAGYSPPQSGVVFVNEFHNWSRQLKDNVIKQALEKGLFPINNPNGGLSEIEVPIRFVFASNEGISLLAAREANGQRYGKDLTYDQLLKKWENVHLNKKALKSEILSSNGAVNSRGGGETAPGISEELLNRIQDRFTLLLRPLSPQSLEVIAEKQLNALKERLSDSPLLGDLELSWDPDTPRIIQEYDYSPEENARPISDRVTSLIEEPLIDALRSKQIKKSLHQSLHLKIESNSDGSRSLVILNDVGSSTTEVRSVIRSTLKDIPKPPISDERIDELAGLDSYLKSNVFGIDNIVERIAERALSIENETSSASARPVNVISLNGLTSTGKTETAKQLAKFLSKSDDELLVFDFSQIQTLDHFKDQILGLKDSFGNPVPSRFMKSYDRANGKLIVAFDELANVRDRELLTAFFDFFREPVMTTFSDGKPRPMGGVVVIVTGNPGQEDFSQVPNNLPMEVQMLAWQEIAQTLNNSESVRRSILERYYPRPLLARFGRNNVFFLPPHDYKSLRQLAQLKTGQAIARLANQDSRRGWNIKFPSPEEYSRFIDTIIEEGFSLPEQGASIEHFVQDDFEEKMKSILLKNKIPSGSTVVLSYKDQSSNQNTSTTGFVFYDVYVDGLKQPLEYKIRRPYQGKELKKDNTNDFLTAFHEVGHNLMRKALFPETYTSTLISIVPGVSFIGDRWLYYAGVAKSEQEKEAYGNRDFFVKQIAVLLAGETAERMVTRGHSSAGKENDISRASALARDVVVRFGLSTKWGLSAAPAGQTAQEYISDLSSESKALLEQEVAKLLNEGRDLAEQIILANFNEIFIPLSLQLAEKGTLNEEELARFYNGKNLATPAKLSFMQKKFGQATKALRKWTSFDTEAGGVPQIEANIPWPKSFVDIRKVSEDRKKAQYAEVPVPSDAPIGTNSAFENSKLKAAATCDSLLAG